MLNEQILEASHVLGLSPAVIHKDYFVTKVIHLLSEINDRNYALIFQGGTCLSKAYHVIKRMSEDCDFRLVQKLEEEGIGKSIRRKRLRDFRYQIIKSLKQEGFLIHEDNIKVLYEGTLMKIKLSYENLAEERFVLKPHIAIDFYLSKPNLPKQSLLITTLIKDALGDSIDHPVKNFECLSLDETAAEKWIALTRRVSKSNSSPETLHDEQALVRHLYDLYQLAIKNLINKDMYDQVNRLLMTEPLIHRNESINYAGNTTSEIEKAISSLIDGEKWRNYWDNFIDVMVYDEKNISYDTVLSVFVDLSRKVMSNSKIITG